MYGMQITYYHTLYKSRVTRNVFGSVEFTKDGVRFYSGGHGYLVDYKYVISIEPLEE